MQFLHLTRAGLFLMAISAGIPSLSQVSLDSTRIPLVIINTHGAEIADEPKTSGTMRIIYREGYYNKPTDSANMYSGYIGIELRGKYSQSFPQKSYGVETRDAQGNNLNVRVLGMPPENDWILLGNYNDKVFMRNTLAFALFEGMGHYAPRTRLCEVIVNDEYMGIFVLTEKIKRDNNRVDIAKLDRDDNAGDSLTGGYIFAVDYFDESNSWISNYPAIERPGQQIHFVYKYPEPGDMTVQQKDYIKWYVNSMESRLYGNQFMDPVTGYAAYLDVNSFIDYFIIGEISRNVDAYKKSCFYHKNRNDKGGLLQAGPVWDFDWAWKNIWDNCYIYEETDGSNWAYLVNECNNWPVVPSWIVRMLEDPSFRGKLHERYFSLREGVLSDTSFTHYIDSVQVLVDEAQKRHYQRWPILNENAGAPEVDPPAGSFAGEIEKFRNWITLRLAWLDANMPDEGTTGLPEKAGASGGKVRLFPNPVHDLFYIESTEEMQQIRIYDNNGRLICQSQEKGTFTFSTDMHSQPAGLYLATLSLENGQLVTLKFQVIR